MTILMNESASSSSPGDAAVDGARRRRLVLVLACVVDRLGEVGGERLGEARLGLGRVTAMWMAFGYCWPLKRQPRVRMKSFTW